MKFSVVIVHYDSPFQLLHQCIVSLRAQTYAPYEICIIDNSASGFNSTSKNELPGDIRILCPPMNTYYAGGANLGLANTSGDLILLCNPDIVFDSSYLFLMEAAFRMNTSLAIVGGMLLRNSNSHDRREEVIDEAGKFCDLFLRTRARGADEKYLRRTFPPIERVLAVSGAALVCRRSSLECVKVNNGEYFDEWFRLYKEDVDLCWRLIHNGWDIAFVRDAIAWHARIWKQGGKRSEIERVRRFHSFKNQYALLVKNLPVCDLLARIIFRLGFEVAMLVYALLFENFLFGAYKQVMKELPRLLRMRKVNVTLQEYFRRPPLVPPTSPEPT